MSGIPSKPWKFRDSVLPGLSFALATCVVAAIVGPTLGGDTESESRRRALADLNQIGLSMRFALRDARTDVARCESWPDVLYGPGVTPNGRALVASRTRPISSLLVRDDFGLGAAWKGPYLDAVPIDPWGRSYLVNLRAIRSGDRLWVISAGPDGVVETNPRDVVLAGDDVGVILVE